MHLLNFHLQPGITAGLGGLGRRSCRSGLAPRLHLAFAFTFLICMSRIFPPAFFLDHPLLVLVPGLLSGTQVSPFHCLGSLRADAQQMSSHVLASFNSSLLTGGFKMHNFYLAQVLPKFTASPYRLLSASSRFLLESSKVQFQPLTPTHTHAPNYLLPVSIHNISFFFFFNRHAIFPHFS